MEKEVEARLLSPSGFLATFEQLCIFVPAALVICTVPFYVRQAICTERCIQISSQLFIKLGVVAAWSAVQIRVVFQWWETIPQETTLTHMGATACLFLERFPGSDLDDRHGSFSNLLLSHQSGAIHESAHLIMLFKCVLLGMEQLSKYGQAIRHSRNREPSLGERRFGIGNTPLGKWVQSVLILGFRTGIKREQLPELDEQLDAETLYQLFKPKWQKANKSSDYALIRAFFHTKPWLFLSTMPPLALKSVFRLSQPFLIRDLLVTLSLQNPTDGVVRRVITITAMIYLGLAVSSAWSNYHHIRLSIAFRAVTEAAIYNKCLTLNTSKVDIPSVSDLVRGDLGDLDWLIITFYTNWNTMLEIAFNLTMLAIMSGPSAILLVLPALLAGANAIRIGTNEMVDRQKWRDSTREHVAFTSNILAQMKDIKMLGLGTWFGELMKQSQAEEIRASLPVRYAESIGFLQGAFTESMTPFAAVALAMFPMKFVDQLSVPDFCCAVGIGLTSMQPLAYAVRSMSDRLRGLDCIHRIQSFLLQPDNRDSRICAPQRLYMMKRYSDSAEDIITRFAVQFIDVSVNLDAEDPILQGVSLLIPMGKITMVYGRTGSGKSVFLNMIIGQAALSCGTLIVATKRIAYSSQKPWITNTSIRDNIVGQNPFDSEWLNLVIYICALDADLARLPNGVLTVAGSGGCTLSGGQKHRISFARSLYSKEEIIVVDDLFTCLDKKTSSDIRVRLFGETEVLRAHDITLIMTTTMREHLVDADLALEITDGGLICEANLDGNQPSSSTRPNGVGNSVYASADEPPVVQPAPLIGGPIIEMPDRIYGNWSLFKFFLRPAGMPLILLWIYTAVTAAAAENLPVIFVCFWMENSSENRSYLLNFAIFSLANPIFNHFTSMTHFYFIYTRTARSLYAKVAETTTRATFDFLSSTDLNFLLNKFSQDVVTTTEGLPLLLMPIAWNFVLLIVNMTAFSLASSSRLLPVAIVACLFVVQLFYTKTKRHLRVLHGGAGGAASRQLSDTADGADHIYSYGWQAAFLEQWYCTLRKKHQAQFHLVCASHWMTLMVAVLTALAAITIVTRALNSEEKPANGIVAFAMFSVIVFDNNMRMLINPWATLDSVLNGIHRIRTFVNLTPVEVSPVDMEPISPQWARRGKIELSCVTAQYRPIGGARYTALDHVSFTIQPGHIVGISGRTGSGKSSLLMAMLNLLHFEGGIFIDDREIRTIPHELLRSRITIMTQSVLELKGTVRFNMNPFDPTLIPNHFLLSDDMLIGILRRVGLWGHIQSRGGLDAKLSLMRFSNGHKQLFQLARATLHKQMMQTRIIFIDEGAPNAEIEDHVRQVMREVFSGCTILMVSHRPSLFREADRILTIDKGRTCLYEHDRQQGVWSANRWNR